MTKMSIDRISDMTDSEVEKYLSKANISENNLSFLNKQKALFVAMINEEFDEEDREDLISMFGKNPLKQIRYLVEGTILKPYRVVQLEKEVKVLKEEIHNLTHGGKNEKLEEKISQQHDEIELLTRTIYNLKENENKIEKESLKRLNEANEFRDKLTDARIKLREEISERGRAEREFREFKEQNSREIAQMSTMSRGIMQQMDESHEMFKEMANKLHKETARREKAEAKLREYESRA